MKKRTVAMAVVCAVLIINLVTIFALTSTDLFKNLLSRAATPSIDANESIGKITDNSALIETLIPKTETAQEGYLDDTIFVGDSITYGMGLYGLFDKNRVFAKVGLHQVTARTSKILYTSENKKLTIADGLKKTKPGKVIVTLGINAVSYLDINTFIKEYDMLLTAMKKASPKSEFIIQSIFPVAKRWHDANPAYTIEKIDRANYELVKLAKSQGIYFLYTSEGMKDEDGYLKDELHSGDGLHLNLAGYNYIFEYIYSHTIKSSGKLTPIILKTPPVAHSSKGNQSEDIILPSLPPLSEPSGNESEDTSDGYTSDNPSSTDTTTSVSSQGSDTSSSSSSSAPPSSQSGQYGSSSVWPVSSIASSGSSSAPNF